MGFTYLDLSLRATSRRHLGSKCFFIYVTWPEAAKFGSTSLGVAYFFHRQGKSDLGHWVWESQTKRCKKWKLGTGIWAKNWLGNWILANFGLGNGIYATPFFFRTLNVDLPHVTGGRGGGGMDIKWNGPG